MYIDIHPFVEQLLVFALHNSVALPCSLFSEICCYFRIQKLCHMPFKHLATHLNFHNIWTVRSCKPRRGAFNKGGSQTDDRQILLLDLGSKFHGDSLCSGACFEPALTLWFRWSHLCQMWLWELWASRILDHCPSCPFLGCSFGASVLPSPSNVLLKRRLLNVTAARLCGNAAFTCTCGTCFTCINCWEWNSSVVALQIEASRRVGDTFPTFIFCTSITDDLYWQWWHLISLCFFPIEKWQRVTWLALEASTTYRLHNEKERQKLQKCSSSR